MDTGKMTATPAIPLAGMSPRKIYDILAQRVIGQERAKRVLSLAAWNHVKRINDAIKNGGRTDIKKANILMIGPTGVGKTHMARVMAEHLGLPFIVADATEYTEAGYYGKDVEVMIAELLHSCDMNLAACERGIIFVDEVDKIARKTGGARTGAGNRDIGGEGVQQSLLKLLEGRKLYVPLNVTQHWNKHDFVEVDTTNILFICAGTFTDVREMAPAGGIGFETGGPRRKLKRISHEQLLESGMVAEFLGRLPVVVPLDFLDAGDLVRILTEPPDALVKEYVKLLAADGVKLEFLPEAVRAIAEVAVKRNVGARGLRAIMEEVLHDLMFEGPDLKDKNVTVIPDFVKEKLAGFDSGMSGS